MNTLKSMLQIVLVVVLAMNCIVGARIFRQHNQEGINYLHLEKLRKSFKQTFITTNDNVKLSVLEAGQKNKNIMVLLTGWSQTATMYGYSIDHFKQNYHVLALDWRGHGESQKVEYGYRHARLANDLRELITQRNLTNITLMAHSMGNAVFLQYWELYRFDHRISKMIFNDQGAMLLDVFPKINGTSEGLKYGASFLPTNLDFIYQTLTGLDGKMASTKQTKLMLESFFGTEDNKNVPIDWILKQNLLFPRASATKLLINTVSGDYRDTIATIDIPCFVLGGMESVVPYKSMEWIYSQLQKYNPSLKHKLHIFTTKEKDFRKVDRKNSLELEG